ncbi:ADP-ribosylglycohydrolase family protein [Siphonobacter aquaeclarae]|uniref:ADP-ribosylglycohydrolase n=1 Tax=Siphonobacter aquaeclarae TaxID=563176 RepID=A0A1G9S2N3_9BACT|nr:ADP-ribosylglycohydrolase family protein [Siphonobacter aquaeclarae]SDM29674.1 ADP-ribosylglycohydrolase [Siphonobacter aquaeclarae]
MKKSLTCLLLGISLTGWSQQTVRMTKESLQNKLKGGWAGQVIGCTFGGPTEFRYNGTYIQDYQAIPWPEGYIRQSMLGSPSLYDDLYMDLTFVDVFEKKGIDAPVAEHAKAYANADYRLWHANQVGRYNILNGLMPPESGHWKNNPQADAIDFQIEADFAGLMSPGMPKTATDICDGIGHIMNYGDGWYGGVYMAAMYSLAYVSSDVNYVVSEALKTIPEKSTFHRCIADVIRWHKQYPDDWKQTWFEVQKKWSSDRTVPEGIFLPFNIDATVNAAYVVIGLLYGKGDFGKTLEISTRCGQDSDCNPASAGGVLGAIIGYDKIPDFWKRGLKEAEDIDFRFTTMSLNDVYSIGLKHALQVIEKQGGKVSGNTVEIRTQRAVPVRFEESFPGHYPKEKQLIDKNLEQDYVLDFEGIGYVINGEAKKKKESEYVFRAEVYLDGRKVEEVSLPTLFRERRFNFFYGYDLKPGKHQLRLKVLNPSPDHDLRLSYVITFDNQPNTKTWKTDVGR